MKRLPEELYVKYRERRLKAQRALKIYLRGHIWWYSKNLGTYRKGGKNH